MCLPWSKLAFPLKRVETPPNLWYFLYFIVHNTIIDNSMNMKITFKMCKMAEVIMAECGCIIPSLHIRKQGQVSSQNTIVSPSFDPYTNTSLRAREHSASAPPLWTMGNISGAEKPTELPSTSDKPLYLYHDSHWDINVVQLLTCSEEWRSLKVSNFHNSAYQSYPNSVYLVQLFCGEIWGT